MTGIAQNVNTDYSHLHLLAFSAGFCSLYIAHAVMAVPSHPSVAK